MLNETTIKVIHWIWGEPKLADFLREIAAGKKIPPHDEIFEYGDDALACWISDFVFPEDRSRGILAWSRIAGRDSERRVKELYEELTEGRKTPAGRREWLDEMQIDRVRDALLGADGMSEIYVHATTGRYHLNNRYLVRDSDTVAESGWTASSGMWGLAEKDRQVCPLPIGEKCSCEVAIRGT